MSPEADHAGSNSCPQSDRTAPKDLRVPRRRPRQGRRPHRVRSLDQAALPPVDRQRSIASLWRRIGGHHTICTKTDAVLGVDGAAGFGAPARAEILAIRGGCRPVVPDCRHRVPVMRIADGDLEFAGVTERAYPVLRVFADLIRKVAVDRRARVNDGKHWCTLVAEVR